MTQAKLGNRIGVLFGGHIAEESVFGEASTGVADDVQKAINIAKRMVKDYGMSERLGAVSLDESIQPTFMTTTDYGGPHCQDSHGKKIR